MDQYIPPIYAVASGMVLVLLCFTLRIPFFIIGLVSILFVIYSFRDHMYRFSGDYHNFSAPDFFKQHASTLIITIVIVMSLGFLLLRFGPRAVMTNQPISAVPGQRSMWNWFGTSSSQVPQRSMWNWFGQPSRQYGYQNYAYNGLKSRYENFLKSAV
jgi:hypothetical protein